MERIGVGSQAKFGSGESSLWRSFKVSRSRRWDVFTRHIYSVIIVLGDNIVEVPETEDAEFERLRHQLEEELDRYLKSPRIPRKKIVDGGVTISSDALEWWRVHGQYQFPNLARKVVPVTLLTPGSSICSERLFSEAGLVYEEKRKKMLADRANSVIFLHHNLLRGY